jgi:hypothetical protein
MEAGLEQVLEECWEFLRQVLRDQVAVMEVQLPAKRLHRGVFP